VSRSVWCLKVVAVHRTGKEVTELGGQSVQPGERAVMTAMWLMAPSGPAALTVTSTNGGSSSSAVPHSG
jgi:hypothetical protein